MNTLSLIRSHRGIANFMNDIASAAKIQFIDDQSVDWSNVRRVRCQFYQRFHYAYPGPIQNLKQRLIVIPADQYGTQRLSSHTLSVSPAPDARRQQYDRFGNRIIELEVAGAHDSIWFEVLMTVESEANTGGDLFIAPGAVPPLVGSTPLTEANAEIKAVARQLQHETSNPFELAQKINDWVFTTMHYAHAVTTVSTTAAEALVLRRGLCQDFSHVMLSICRAVGLPARYVSGHLLGEGGSHAWVEVLLPAENGFRALAFDPTNGLRPHLGYITVAVGRDYSDVSPTSGSFVAPYGGQLTCSKRAGLTFIEFLNGDVIRSSRLQ
jgi:transglutaminase-like putative cysteine protease